MLHDRELSFAARCIYGVLAETVWQGTTARIGQRRIAFLLGCTQETVGIGLRELEARKHISIVGAGKERRVYVLHSDVFGQKQGRKDVIVGGRYVSVDCERQGIANVL